MQKRMTPLVFVVCLAIGAAAVAGTNTAFAATAAILDANEAMWKRVQRLSPGARVKVTVAGGEAAERYFVLLTDTELIVLNLSVANLPKRQLLNMAADNPTWVAGTSKTTYRDNSLRVGPDGVFIKDRKIAELAQVVEHIPRDRVTLVVKS